MVNRLQGASYSSALTMDTFKKVLNILILIYIYYMVFLLRRRNVLRVWVQSADQQQFSHHVLKLPVPYTVTDGQIKQFLLDNTLFVTLTAKCFVFSLILSRDVLIITDF